MEQQQTRLFSSQKSSHKPLKTELEFEPVTTLDEGILWHLPLLQLGAYIVRCWLLQMTSSCVGRSLTAWPRPPACGTERRDTENTTSKTTKGIQNMTKKIIKSSQAHGAITAQARTAQIYKNTPSSADWLMWHECMIKFLGLFPLTEHFLLIFPWCF